jgi:hypothetical protein
MSNFSSIQIAFHCFYWGCTSGQIYVSHLTRNQQFHYFGLYKWYSIWFDNCAKFVLYADDSSVLVTANNNTELQSQLQFALNKISNWFTVNWLLLNMEKRT